MQNARLALLFLLPIAAMRADEITRSRIPLLFVENRGQAPSDVQFTTATSGSSVSFLSGAVEFHLREGTVRITFQGARIGVDPECGPAAGKANFLIGASSNWVVGAPLCRSVIYRNVYPGIDVLYGANGRSLKSEFILRPGADPAQIRVQYSGGGKVQLDGPHALRIAVQNESFREEGLVLYQRVGKRRMPVEGSFFPTDDDTVAFRVGKYDARRPLIIDPVFSYSTVLGGSAADAAMSIAVDSTGAAYVAGFTESTDFPTRNPVQNLNHGSNDIFLAKLNPSGNNLVYCTYLGGTADDRAFGIAVDAAGAVYVTGSTTSKDFPVVNALQSRLTGAKNAFAVKLSPTGNSLIYSTYLGGNGSDSGNGIAVDAAGSAYIVGDTSSVTLPTTGLQRSNHGGVDAFVAKLSVDGKSLVYSTYLGGNGLDHGAAIALDSSGSAYVTGSTYSTDFPVASPFQVSNAGGEDAFVAKLSVDGSRLMYSTYLGGSGGGLSYVEEGRGITVDVYGDAYVAGMTSSANFPVMQPIQSSLNGFEDAFVAKFSPAGWLLYCTYLGGSGVDGANAIAVDSNGNAYVVGFTYSQDLPVLSALQSNSGGDSDGFLAKIAASGGSLSYLSYLGGAGGESATSVALGGGGNIYVAGWTTSSNFPEVSPFQTINGGNYGAFIAKMTVDAVTVSVGVSPGTATLYESGTQQFTATVLNTSNTAVTWSINPSSGFGSISSNGLYTAPADISVIEAVTVTATSQADTTKANSATITLMPPVSVSLSPAVGQVYGGSTLQFTAAVLNTNNTAVTWSISPSTGAGAINGSGLFTAPTIIATPLLVTIMATSAADPTKSAWATVQEMPGTPIRVNAGGGAYSDSQGNGWAADSGFVGGAVYASSATVLGTADSTLYQTVRYNATGPVVYQASVPNGNYAVSLKFAEPYYTSAGARVFSVALNGTTVRTGVDVFAEAGGINRALDLSFPATVTGGQVTLTLTGVVAAPMISAVQIAPFTPIRVNAGGASYIDTEGNGWSAESGFQGGASYNSGATILGTIDSPLYQTVRYNSAGPVAYQFAVPNGSYSVLLKFAEPYFTSAGQRVFNVALNGTTVRDRLDVFATAGGIDRALDLSFPVLVSAGQITVVLTAVSAAPIVSAIQIVPFAGIRVNAGGTGYRDTQGNVWEDDTGSQGGATYGTGAGVAGTSDQTLYQTVRYNSTGPLAYRFAVPNGSYVVTLKFSEPFFMSSGQRVFNVALNGTVVRTALDVFATAGGINRALDLSYPVTVKGGEVTVTLTGVIAAPIVNAIQIQ